LVPPQGYQWWYVDAISDDGQFGLTIIGFIGSVFSPYYKKSGRNQPINYSCLNVALYGPRHARWAMTERGAPETTQQCDMFAVGPSAMRWENDSLIIDIDERDKRVGVPWRRRVKGKVVVHPEMLNRRSFKLDPEGRHCWHPIAPRARVEMVMENPDISWKGSAYIDSNSGSEPIEDGFQHWHWSRAHIGKDVAVTYEGLRRDGSYFASALRFDANGDSTEQELPPIAPLPRTLWGVNRQTRADGGLAKINKTWEDTPFYCRSALDMQIDGQQVMAVQESISLDRLINPVVQWLLPFRMPRETGR
jgi:carotenoid 1,2-hydratase